MSENAPMPADQLWAKIRITFGVLIIFGLFLLLFLPGINGGPAAPILQCSNNTRNVGTALLAYAAEHEDQFPLAYTVNEEGQHLHSWRTTMMPYLERSSLHRIINKSEPWNHETNEQWRETEIGCHRCPSDESLANNGTSLFLITGSGTIFPEGKQITISEVSEADGLATTILLTEAADMHVEWIQPQDIPFGLVTAPPSEMKGYGPSSYHSTVNVFFADGHAASINQDIAPQVLRALITWNGGEEIPEEF